MVKRLIPTLFLISCVPAVQQPEKTIYCEEGSLNCSVDIEDGEIYSVPVHPGERRLTFSVPVEHPKVQYIITAGVERGFIFDTKCTLNNVSLAQCDNIASVPGLPPELVIGLRVTACSNNKFDYFFSLERTLDSCIRLKTYLQDTVKILRYKKTCTTPDSCEEKQELQDIGKKPKAYLDAFCSEELNKESFACVVQPALAELTTELIDSRIIELQSIQNNPQVD